MSYAGVQVESLVQQRDMYRTLATQPPVTSPVSCIFTGMIVKLDIVYR